MHELPKVIAASGLPIDGTRASIFGHCSSSSFAQESYSCRSVAMGGHGALTAYLKNHSAYRSASAFAPICNPTKAPWGEKAFGGYLAGGVAEGAAYDATELLSEVKGKQVNILVDVGLADDFYKKGQLLPENFVAAAKAASFSEADVQVNLHEGYDHSYYFISTFAPVRTAFLLRSLADLSPVPRRLPREVPQGLNIELELQCGMSRSTNLHRPSRWRLKALSWLSWLVREAEGPPWPSARRGTSPPAR